MIQPAQKPHPAKALEAKVKQTVKGILAKLGAYAVWPVPTGYGSTLVDCYACVPVTITKDMVGHTVGVFVAIETKREGIETATPRQDTVLASVGYAGGVPLLLNSSNAAVVEATLLEALDRGTGRGHRAEMLATHFITGMLK